MGSWWWPIRLNISYHGRVWHTYLELLTKPRFVLNFRVLVTCSVRILLDICSCSLDHPATLGCGVSECATCVSVLVCVDYILSIKYWKSTGVFVYLGVSTDPNRWTSYYLESPNWPLDIGLSECQQAKTRGTLVRGASWLRNHLPHMPDRTRTKWCGACDASTQLAVGAAKHHSQNAYLTTMFGQYIGGYFNNYGFNLRQNSPLIIENNTAGWIRACANRPAITEVGRLLKRHTLVPSPTIPLHSVAWIEKGQGNSLKCNSANFSARRSQSGGIPGTWLLC